MKYQFYSVHALDPVAGQESVNRFCASHTLVSVEKQFVPAGLDSYWAFCIQYADGNSKPEDLKKKKIDYREVFGEADFAVYAKLRTLRKTLAEKEGVPLYALFTNDQLAAMVRERITCASAMLQISGVGKARVDKYGMPFVEMLTRELKQGGKSEKSEN